MTNSKSGTANPPRLWIVTGRGPALGRGHARRMTVLADMLRTRGHRVELICAEHVRDFQNELTELAGRPAPGELRILDARDVDPRPFRAGGPLFALDNRHPARPALERAGEPGLIFYDTLPHPELDPVAVLPRVLLAPELVERAAGAGPDTAQKRDLDILVYSGDVTATGGLDRLLLACVREEPNLRVLRVGRTPLAFASAGIEWRAELEPAAFYDALRRARSVWAYFGMTLFEAWFAGAVPVLYGIDSPVHDTLSEDFARRTGLLYLRELPAEPAVALAALRDREPTGPRPDGRGYERLVELIERNLPDDGATS